MNRKLFIIILSVLLTIISGLIIYANLQKEEYVASNSNNEIKLPSPALDGKISLEKAISTRRSIRSYKNEASTLSEISQILYAAGGISDKSRGFRTNPSAGAIYPIEIFIAIKNVENLDNGFYQYNPLNHSLIKKIDGELNNAISSAALGQSSIVNAAAVIVLTENYSKIEARYKDRAVRYTHIEIGHIGQNIYLQANVLNIGTVAIGAFYDEKMSEALKLDKKLTPLYIMPLGRI